MGKVLFIACTNVGQAMISEICENPEITSKVCGIVNLNIRRGASKANYQTYADTAAEYDIPIHYCENVNDAETIAFIKECEPDLIIQTGWSQKFHDELLELPRYGCIGEHPAPLPKGRGAACINWAILTGETEWGDSFFRMVSQYDKGELFAQDYFKIEEYDTVKTVYDKVAETSVRIIRAHIDEWTNGQLNGVEQTDEGATYYKKRCPADGVFDFSWDAKRIHDFIRAQTTPYPGAFFLLNDNKVTVLLSSLSGKKYEGIEEGTIVGSCKGKVEVVCSDGGSVYLHRLRYKNRPECWAADFVSQNGIKSFAAN